MNTLPFAII